MALEQVVGASRTQILDLIAAVQPVKGPLVVLEFAVEGGNLPTIALYGSKGPSLKVFVPLQNSAEVAKLRCPSKVLLRPKRRLVVVEIILDREVAAAHQLRAQVLGQAALLAPTPRQHSARLALASICAMVRASG